MKVLSRIRSDQKRVTSIALVALLFCFPVLTVGLFGSRAVSSEINDLPKCPHIPYDIQKDVIKTSLGNEGYANYAERAKRPACRKEWTVLVYMNVDKDLKAYSLWDLFEMEASQNVRRLTVPGYKSKTASTETLDVLVEQDYIGETQGRRYHMFETNRPWIRKKKDELAINKEIFESADARNLTQSPIAYKFDSQTPFGPHNFQQRLQDFLEWGIKNYPAENYMVVLWGHGHGWMKSKATSGAISVFQSPASHPQNESPTFIDTKAVHESAQYVSQKYLGGRPIDILASDACLMQAVEVAGELSADFRFISGSQQIQTYLGLPYRRIFLEINTGRYKGNTSNSNRFMGDDLAAKLAFMIPKFMAGSLAPADPRSHLAGYQSGYDPTSMQKFTASVVDALALRNVLVPALNKLGVALHKFVLEKPVRMDRLAAKFKKMPDFVGYARDLGLFTEYLNALIDEELLQLKKDGQPWPQSLKDLHDTLVEVHAAREYVLLSYFVGPAYRKDFGVATSGQLGAWSGAGIVKPLSIWIPDSEATYKSRIADFRLSWFYTQSLQKIRTRNSRGVVREIQLPGWGDWLDQIYGPVP